MTKSNEIPTKPFSLNWDADPLTDPFSEPEHEPRPPKSLTLINNTGHTVKVARLQSDWKSVNFLLESEDTPKYDKYPRKTYKELAILYPSDRIEIIFHPNL